MDDYVSTYADDLEKYAPLKGWAEARFGEGAAIVDLRFDFWPSRSDSAFEGNIMVVVPATLNIYVDYLPVDSATVKSVNLYEEDALKAAAEIGTFLVDSILAVGRSGE